MAKRPAQRCSSSTDCKAQCSVIITPSSSLPELPSPCLLSSNSHHCLPLCHLCCRLPHPHFPWLIVVCRADWVWHCWWCCHFSDGCYLILSSPCPPHQERRVETSEGGRGCGGNCLGMTQRHCHVVGRQAKQVRGCFHGHHCQHPLWKQSFFARTAKATRKTKIGDCQCTYMHWRLPINELVHQSCWKEVRTLPSWGGQLPCCQKNGSWLLLICLVFGYTRCC